jgi:hypothetical protein
VNIRSLTKGLNYLREVESKRQTYYIFQSPKQYLLMTFKDDGKTGNFSLVDSDAVDYVFSKTRGKQNLTVTEVRKHSRKPNYTASQFDPLKIMYILVLCH